MVSIGIIGLRGSGKTTLEVLLGYIVKKKDGSNVLSNFKVSYAKQIEPIKFLEFSEELNNSTILLDEIYTILESLLSSNRGEREFSYYFNQARKRKVHFIWTSQLKRVVNSRITDLTEYVYMATAIRNYKIKDEKQNLIACTYQRFWESTPLGKPLIIYAKQFKQIGREDGYKNGVFDMFNSDEIIYPQHFLKEHNVKIEHILTMFQEAPTKMSFVSDFRKTYPFFAKEDIQGAYDYLKMGNIDKAKKILGL